jgi:hypothetical protein
MANKRVWLGISGIILIFGLFLSGCATDVATSKGTNFEKRSIGLIGVPKYTVLGAINLERNWFGILGVTTPAVTIPLLSFFSPPFLFTIPGSDIYLYQSGGVTYVDLLAEAKKQYPDADAVIDIKVDYSGSNYAIFYGSRKNIFSGVAIKYSRDIVDYPPTSETYILGEKRK